MDEIVPRKKHKGPKTPTEQDRANKEAFEEVFSNEPKIVKHTRRKFGKKRAEKQKKKIALEKAERKRRGGSKARR